MTAVRFYSDGFLANLFICGTLNQPISLGIIPTTGELNTSENLE